MKLLLSQIFDFGLERVKKELIVVKGNEYVKARTSKRYNKNVIYKVAKHMGYSTREIANYNNCSINSVQVALCRTSFKMDEEVDEMLSSLRYVYK